jgi:DegV family protein with EDD domain
MSKVVLVTDSTSYIPKEIIKQYNIQVAPQVLIWGDDVYRDGIDIQSQEFFTRLRTAKVMPSTSQVNPQSFTEIFTPLAEQGAEILAVLISSKLSKTIDSARQAKELLPDAKIEIVDSETTAMALGFHVITAARAAQSGASLEECKAVAEKARKHTGVVFAVDTLEFLHRGGRIGGAQRFLGTALGLKPILEVTEGHVEGVEKIRTRRKSLDRLLEIMEERIAGRQPVRIATLHADAEQEARQLLELGNQKFGCIENIFTEVSPVVATHAGPGTVGLAFMAGM